MRQPTTHKEQLVFLKKIEGQVRGIQKMIDEGRYCVDILNQVHSVIYALARVEDKILEKHFEHCVASAVKGKSENDRKEKLDEILQLISRFRKT
ncbi:MAG: metal-sensitive transcriptional regulator [Candidatus Omnitrophica bacterium]|nr:metal-sensitive transcriptional regulator [Candidatus Omnitrophota bacterium]MBU1923312.1 metal-sensitive transcriptional regulator [Candidatus Omnitrophota bacterium]